MHKIKLDTIGTDPEFFIVHTDSGEPYSPIAFTTGTKNKPEELGNGYALMMDNLTLEGNVPPAKSKKEFIDNFNHLKKLIYRVIADFHCQIYSVGELEFADTLSNSKQGQEYGCSSVNYAWQDIFDIISGDILSIPKSSPNFRNSNIRTAGFHIHIGYTIKKGWFPKSAYDNIIAKLFDLFVTIPSNIIHTEPYRLSKFGYPGNYRNKDYGVECRTLSSYFTQEKYLPWVYEQVEKLFQYLNILDEEQLIALLLGQIFDGEVDNVTEYYQLVQNKLEKTLPGTKSLITASSDVSLINSKYEKINIIKPVTAN